MHRTTFHNVAAGRKCCRHCTCASMQDMLTTNQKVSGGHVAPAVQNQGHFGAVRGCFVGLVNRAAKRWCLPRRRVDMGGIPAQVALTPRSIGARACCGVWLVCVVLGSTVGFGSTVVPVETGLLFAGRFPAFHFPFRP